MSQLVTQLKHQPFRFITPLRLAAILLTGYFLYFMLAIYSSEGRSFVVAGVLVVGIIVSLVVDWMIKRIVKKVAYIWIIEVMLCIVVCLYILTPSTMSTNSLPLK